MSEETGLSWEKVDDKVTPEIVRRLERQKDIFEELGWNVSKVKNLDSDIDTRRFIEVETDEGVEFSVEYKIVHSYDYEGADLGFNIERTVQTSDGQVLDSRVPYVWTDKIWTKSIDELKERLYNMGLVSPKEVKEEL